MSVLSRMAAGLVMSILFIGWWHAVDPARRLPPILEDAALAVGEGRVTSALRILEPELAADPGDIRIVRLIAQAYLADNQPRRAYEALHGLTDQQRATDEIRMLEGRALVRSGRHAKGLGLLARYAPEHGLTPQDLDQALDGLVRFRPPEPTRVAYPDPWRRKISERLLGQGDLGHSLDWAFSESDPPEEGDDHLDRILDAWLVDCGNLAAERVEPLAAGDGPTRVLVRRRIALDRGLRSEALRLEDHFIEAGLEHPMRGELLSLASARRLALGEVAHAERLAREAIALDPRDLSARLGHGRALKAQGREDEAKGAFEAALALDPTDREARRLVDRWERKSQRSRTMGDLELHLKIPGESSS